MKVLQNTFRRTGRPITLPAAVPFPSTDTAAVTALLARCPAAAATPLLDSPLLAQRTSVATVMVKDERARMGLGSFKALGAAYVIATHAVATGKADTGKALAGSTYVTASAGNHGLSVAAGARIFGARAVVVIAETVPDSFADRLRDKGAEVIRAGADYEASMAAAETTARENGWTLLSDSSWEGYVELPHRLMEGYLALMDEVASQTDRPPTHIFVQAGVGGLAGAVAAFARDRWGDAPVIAVIEPQAAPALYESAATGHPVTTAGPVSIMGRLDCKDPSLIALKGLARDADVFITITEDEAADAMPVLADAGLATSPSGGAGLAALLASGPHRDAIRLTPNSRVLAFLTEEPQP